jgi:uncharacterized protein YbjT (DUF2867 family)
MLLLTGATGLIGSALLDRLVADGQPVRCLVRDPRRLGPQRVRVQIALGDLGEPRSFRNAMRGVDTVVHLATATRDQPTASIEELTAMAGWGLLQAAQRAGVARFVLLCGLGASAHHPARLLRAQAIAEQAVQEAELPSTVIATSLAYAPGDRWISLVERLSLLPVVLVPGQGRALCQPIWVEDLADCIVALLGRPSREAHERYELAGPQTLSYDEAIRTVLRSVGRERPLLHVPAAIASRALRLLERAAGPGAPLTWDEAQLLRADAVSQCGSADAQALGVVPQTMRTVLGFHPTP